MKKIFVTGGHYTPAKAVVDKLLESKEYKVFYIGRKNSLEGDQALSLEYQEMFQRKDIQFLEITTGRLQRKFTSKTIPSLLKIPIGLVQSYFWFAKFNPDLVMSFGGYVSIPISTVAFIFGVPVLNHEQIPAFDYPSKYLNKFAIRSLVSFPYLVKKDEIYTGNPVRQEIFDNKVKLNLPSRQTIYVTGGNQGSHIINETVLKIADKILKKYNLIWQTGDSSQYQDYSKAVSLESKNLMVKKFVNSNEIGSVFAKSSLVIGRSGANTVTELAALKKPSILIPIPWVHDAEQLKNAKELEKYGSTIIIPQKDLTPETLWEAIEKIFSNLARFNQSAKEANTLFIKDSAGRIKAQIDEVLNAKKN